MTKSSAAARLAYSAERLSGLRQRAAQQKQATVERLQAALRTLKGRGDPITVYTIRAECGLDYQSYARNPEALALFREHSTFLAAKRKAARTKQARRPGVEGSPCRKDPLLSYKKTQLVARLHQEMQQREMVERQYQYLLEERVTSELRLMHCEAELAKYHEFLGQFRRHMDHQEHGEPTSPPDCQ
jgi:hypothetical protein